MRTNNQYEYDLITENDSCKKYNTSQNTTKTYTKQERGRKNMKNGHKIYKQKQMN